MTAAKPFGRLASGSDNQKILHLAQHAAELAYRSEYGGVIGGNAAAEIGNFTVAVAGRDEPLRNLEDRRVVVKQDGHKVLDVSMHRSTSLSPHAWSMSQSTIRNPEQWSGQLLQLQPNELTAEPFAPAARMQRAAKLLSSGLYEAGWQEHEARRQGSWARDHGFSQTGRDLSGAQEVSRLTIGPRPETVLVHAEGGMGDTFQFARYARLLRGSFQRVILEVQNPLQSLMGSVPGIDQVITRKDEAPPFQYHIPLVSLPKLLNLNEASIARHARDNRGYIRPDPARVRQWGEWLDATTEGKTPLGVCWRADPNNKFDFGRDLDTPAQLATLNRSGKYTLISLLDDTTEAERKALPGMKVVNPDSARVSFDDMAALMMAIKHRKGGVVAADTAWPHLAGALDIPTVLMLNKKPNWRWGTEGTTAAWYPGFTVLRQEKAGDWAPVITQAADVVERGFRLPTARPQPNGYAYT